MVAHEYNTNHTGSKDVATPIATSRAFPAKLGKTPDNPPFYKTHFTTHWSAS